jgi:diguanylate cyclase (GGDEF)-like protein
MQSADQGWALMVKVGMKTALRRMRLSTELGQAWFRLAGAILVLGGFSLARLGQVGPGLDEMTILTGCYAVLSAIWVQVVLQGLLPGKIRRIVSILFDQLTFAAGILVGDAYCAPLIWMPVSIALGNGLRFGRRYTRLSVYIGAVSTALAVMLSPYWMRQPSLALGLVLSILIVPLYASALNARMARAKRTLERRAARFELASMTDSVTGALNRHGFMSILNDRAMRSTCGVSASALMLLDLDGFKAVNDSCGHAAGDMVLVDTVNRLTRCFRSSDRVARIGGDEFAVLLVDMRDQAQVEQLASLALSAIADIRIEQNPSLALSASIGICMLPHSQAHDLEAMLHLADSLMYEAKKSGKNRFRIAGPDDERAMVAA